MSCPCDDDQPTWEVDIAPGLTRIPRQIAGFTELRRALLSEIGDVRHALPFVHWRAREGTDLGLMLLEMWAYLADILTFYDEVHAHEAYLRTARRRVSVERLVGLLGVRPRPAVGGSVDLALRGQGRLPVVVPAGTGFRSGEVDGDPPQIFELTSAATIHPLRNRWPVQRTAPRTLREAQSIRSDRRRITLHFEATRSTRVAPGDPLMIERVGTNQRIAGSVVSTTELQGPTGRRYREIQIAMEPFVLALLVDWWLPTPEDRSPPFAELRVLAPTATRLLNDTDTTSSDVFSTSAVLDAVEPAITPGQWLLFQYQDEVGWYQVVSTGLETYTRETGSYEPADSTTPKTITGEFRFTELTLDGSLLDPLRGGSSHLALKADRGKVTVHHRLVELGVPVGLPRDDVIGALQLGEVRVPRDDPGGTRFAVADDDGQSVVFDGELDLATGVLLPSTEVPALILPAEVEGNLVRATRGESVLGEVLGSGNAAEAHQTFTLAKAPLTYLPDDTATSGISSTLSVWVDGVRWQEAASFFGVGPTDRVYIVRLDEDGFATLTFGDGVRGARLPTGVDNVIADYRFGAGAKLPDTGSIAQIARPVAGLVSVRQPEPAMGGADAETRDSMRDNAPGEALFLGRAVSVLDYEAAANRYPGVDLATAAWSWDGARQVGVVKVWTIGNVDEDGLTADLEGRSDPTTRIEVEQAHAIDVTLALTVTISPDVRSATEVEQAIAAALGDPDTGQLLPAQLGIAQRIRFSALRAAVHAVSGVIAVTLTWSESGSAVTTPSTRPPEGHYFDLLGPDAFTINGAPYALA